VLLARARRPAPGPGPALKRPRAVYRRRGRPPVCAAGGARPPRRPRMQGPVATTGKRGQSGALALRRAQQTRARPAARLPAPGGGAPVSVNACAIVARTEAAAGVANDVVARDSAASLKSKIRKLSGKATRIIRASQHRALTAAETEALLLFTEKVTNVALRDMATQQSAVVKTLEGLRAIQKVYVQEVYSKKNTAPAAGAAAQAPAHPRRQEPVYPELPPTYVSPFDCAWRKGTDDA
jgi:hypothetical protein